MNRRTILRCGAASFALLCVSLMAAAQESQPPASLHIGVLGPFSGPFEPLGLQVERGVRLAIAAHGVDSGLDITVTLADDRCDEASGRDAANQLIGAQVDIVIGGVCWRPALAARDVFSLEGLPFYASGVRHGGLTDDEVSNLFRVNGRDDLQGAFLAQALRDGSLDELIGGSLRQRALVVLYTDGSYGRTLAETVRDSASEAGLDLAMYEAFEPDEGIARAAARAEAEDPGLVMVLAGQADSALMVSALREELGDTPILTGDSVLTPEFPLLAGEGAERVMFARPTVWREQVDPSILAAFEGEEVGSLLGLVTPSIAATQVAIAQASDGVTAEDAESYATVLGEINFDRNGDAQVPSFELWQWRSGTVWLLDSDVIDADPS